MSRTRSSAPSSSRPGGPQAAADVLLDGDAANPIKRALWLEALDLKLRHCLPPALAAHARLANIDRRKLVYLVDAPIWHAKLRLAATDLLEAARSIGLEVTDLVVKVATLPQTMRPHDAGTSTPMPAPPLSAAAREAFAVALADRDETPPRKDPS